MDQAVQQITDRETALKAVNVLVHEEPRSLPPNWKNLWAASLYALLGDSESALDLLERSYEDRFPLLSTITADPAYDPLRSDPRYVGLIRRMGLKH